MLVIKLKKMVIIPIIVDPLGLITKNLRPNVKKINVDMAIKQIQRF